MLYSVAHVLRGEAYEYHRSLARELTRRYATSDWHERDVPHVTIKLPFEANDYEIMRVEATLDAFAARSAPESFVIEGFGRFGIKTAYLDVVKSHTARMVVRGIIDDLRALPTMTEKSYEGAKLHVSVARFMTHRQSYRVWRHLRHEHPHFKQRLDTLTLLRKDPVQRVWEVHNEFVLAPNFIPQVFVPATLTV